MSRQADGLRYAVRFSVLAKYFGQLCLVVAVLTVLPLVVSLVHLETHIAYRYAVVIIALGGLSRVLGRIAAPREIQINEAMVIVAFMFLFTPLVMSYPMMGSGLTFSNALFEAISGSTTTGLSTVNNVGEMSRTFLFSRAWMQWYGGLGIVVLSLVLLFQPGLIAKRFAVNEANSEDDLIGGTKAHARRVLVIYSILTGLGVLLLLALGVEPFHALLYTMASVSTGGFSPHDASLAGLKEWLAPFSVILICLTCAIPLSSYYGLYQKHRQPATDPLQVRLLLVMGGVATLLLGVCLVMTQEMDWGHAFFHAPILAFSAQTTAGFTSMDLAQLHPGSKLVLILIMAVGGSVGSTAGGLKILRLVIFAKVLGLFLQRLSASRHAMVASRIAGRRMEDAEMQEALLIILLYAAVILLSWLPFVFMGYNPMDALFEVVSATGTVGLSVGVVTSEMPLFLKGILCVDMLLGRLEILAWLVLVYPKTWIGRRLQTK